MTSTLPKAETIFGEAISLSGAAERAAFLKQACGDDHVLRQQIERLVADHFAAGDFMEPPVAATSAPLGHAPIGSQIGTYKLLELIGEGGMGLVYMAEQQRPVRRLVALKVIKPGMDSRQVIARFEAERQALAMMDHPSIAKVFDAGTAETGRSYFAMELVRGLPITEFCDHKMLGIRDRLMLFIQVCQAVQHAHQKGVIHRDLKPTNVLVTMHDAVVVPKIIDFGIAKALGPSLTEHTLHTGFAQLMGTPLYMSPEQAELNALDVDTRSDVYSLGVMLYELLTGTTPFDKDRLKSAGFDEMRRIIREEEPETVSKRLARTRWVGSAHQCAPADASCTGGRSPPYKSRRGHFNLKIRNLQFRELDWIVSRCLEKDRNRRYESASSLAADLQRYLADEPVQACPPSRTYRLAKFVRKSRRVLIPIACVAAALVAGLIGTSWQAVRATTALHLADQRYREKEAAERHAKSAAQQAAAESRRAQDEAQRASAEAQRATASAKRAKTENLTASAMYRFLTKVLTQADPWKEPDRDLRLKTVLDRAAVDIEGAFPKQPLVEAGIRSTLGVTYIKLDDLTAAQLHLERCYELRQRELGDDDTDTLKARQDLAALYRHQGRLLEAQRLGESTLDTVSGVAGQEHQRTLVSKNNLALTLTAQKRYAEAEQLYLQILAAKAPDTSRSATQHNLAVVYHLQGRLAEAESLMSEALLVRRRLLPEDHPALLNSLSFLARIYDSQKRYVEAEPIHEQVLAGRNRAFGEEDKRTFLSANALAINLQRQGKCAKAEPLYRSAVDGFARLMGPDHSDTLKGMSNLAGVYSDQKKYPEAEALYRKVLETRSRTLGPADAATVSSKASLGQVLLLQKRHAEAASMLRDCVAASEQDQSEASLGGNRKSLLGAALVGLAGELLASDVDAVHDQLAEAELLLLSGYQALQSHAAEVEPPSRLTDALQRLVELYRVWNKPDEAARWQVELELRTTAARPAPEQE
jgi:serine/threonine protein kinase/tetratricopeptide (TPR) repeat protein